MQTTNADLVSKTQSIVSHRLKPYIAWVEEDGFTLKKNWNPERGWHAGGPLKLFPHQVDILGHALTPDLVTGRLPYTEVIYSAPKKSGKTAIGASIAGWYADVGLPGSEIYFLANNQYQAQARGYTAMYEHLVERGVKPMKYRAQYPNGTFIEALTAEYAGHAGGDPAVTVWDELWAYETERHRRLWAEMSVPPTQDNPLKIIVTYAGYKADAELLWSIYEDVVLNGEPVPELSHIVDSKGRPVCFRKGRRFVYWDTESRMPWQDKEYYELEAVTQRAGDFVRLHRNQWATSEDPFVPIEWWDKAVERGAEVGLTNNLALLPELPFSRYPLTIAVDAAVKHDCTALIAVYYDIRRGRIGLAYDKIWIPNKEEMFDLDKTVGVELLWLCKKFNVRDIYYDPRFLHQTMVQLRNRGLPVKEYKQTKQNLIAATTTLHDAFQHGTLEVYPAELLRQHIEFAKAATSAAGFQIKKEKNSKHNDDGAVALAMAVHTCLNRGGTDTSRKIRLKMPFGDISKMKVRTRQQILEEKIFPPELRD